jgi:hypothetical protein
MAEAEALHLQMQKAQIQAQGVQVREDIFLEEVRLEGGAIRLDWEPTGDFTLDFGEVKVRAEMSEPNLNRMLLANLPSELPLKNLQFSLFTGKLRMTGNYVKLISIPISVDANLLVLNGIEVLFDLTEMKAGVGMPAAVVEVIEGQLNRTLSRQIGEQIRQLPFPVSLDEIRCEAGRLIVFGRVKLRLPFASIKE